MEFTPILKSFTKLFPSSPLLIKNPIPFTVLILSPHPDDESIIGSLALRLNRENKARVINVAVTLGSNEKRRISRKKELKDACRLLKMDCVHLSEDWKEKESELKRVIKRYKPDLIIAPHSQDFHPAHIKTGKLLSKVLVSFKKETFLVAWSEFWAPLKKPNLLLEVPLEILELQMKALEKHVGEIERNPYHLRLPAWMMDNVRRGSEVVSGKGSEGPQMAFGILYQLKLWSRGNFSSPRHSPFLTSKDDLAQIFKLILDAASGSKTRVK